MNFFSRLRNLFTSNRTEQDNTKIGLVHYFNRKKGYGFISSDETEDDVFVHYTDMEEDIRRGDEVEFEVKKTPKGLRAENVALASA